MSDDYECRLDKDVIIMIIIAFVAIGLCAYGTFKWYGL